MGDQGLGAPYVAVSMEAENAADAATKAKIWVRQQGVTDDSWLQIFLNGSSVASFRADMI
jgi:hypothetical protein